MNELEVSFICFNVTRLREKESQRMNQNKEINLKHLETHFSILKNKKIISLNFDTTSFKSNIFFSIRRNREMGNVTNCYKKG